MALVVVRTHKLVGRNTRGFLPVLHISREKCLRPNLGVSSGFLEIYITTALVNAGFTIGNLPAAMV